MELFIPSIIVFILSAIVVFIITPRLSPLIVTILSFVLLIFVVKNHITLFYNEYAENSWSSGIKTYAPAIMITTIILFLLGAISLYFTKGQVPVPTLPEMNMTIGNPFANNKSSGSPGITERTLNKIL